MRRDGKGQRTSGPIGVVVYVRVSTKEQTQGPSLKVQERECLRYCVEQGWVVLRVFVEEGESAKTANRPQLLQMLEFCRKNQQHVQHVVVHRLDRFARYRYDHVHVAAHLTGLGITLKSVTEPFDESAAGHLVENMIATIAQFDNEVRSERTRAGMEAAVREGR